MTDRCRYVASDQPRVLPDRHTDHCHDEGCRGCQPCPGPHCRVCGVTHSVGACAGCVADTRETLDAIRDMCLPHRLRGEAEREGVSGEAMNLLGPAADPEAWGHVEASVAAGRLPQDWHLLPADARGVSTERHPLVVLGQWEMIYRDAFGHDEAGVVEVWSAVDYLERQLTAAANEPWVPFEQMAQQLRDCRAHLEAELHDGEQIEKGAPCPQCHRPLTLRYGNRVVDDRWVCNNSHCGVDTYTRGQYRGWVEDDALHNADRLTAVQMTQRFRDEDDKPMVKAGEVRVWGSRELVRKRGRNDQGMTLYDVGDVERRIEARRAEDADCA